MATFFAVFIAFGLAFTLPMVVGLYFHYLDTRGDHIHIRDAFEAASSWHLQAEVELQRAHAALRVIIKTDDITTIKNIAIDALFEPDTSKPISNS